jgi:hypothetical protein
LVLLSILLLVLNDHWLKVASPSVLTGKLSDFAGLFFFPFLLVAGMGLLLGRRCERWVVWLSFGLSGAWFAAIKLIPAANGLHRQALGLVWGGPVQVVMDPSDLLALASLPAAWLLWRSLEQKPARQAPGKLAYLALAAASLASLATTPLISAGVDRVLVYQEQLVASGYFDDGNHDRWSLASSPDGLAWRGLADPDPALQALLNTTVTLPKQVCLERQPAICFRITGLERVERSDDGGQNWSATWRMPPGRKQYMERTCGGIEGCWYQVNTVPLDLAVLENAEGFIVLAAMDTQGVLVSQQSWSDSRQQGEWQWVGVQSVNPLPRRALSLGQAEQAIGPEMVASIVIGVLVCVVSSVYAWGDLLRSSGRGTFKERWAVIRPFGWSLLILVVMVLLFVPLARLIVRGSFLLTIDNLMGGVLLVYGILVLTQVVTLRLPGGA